MHRVLAILALACTAACAPKSVIRPSGSRTPITQGEAAAIRSQAARACHAVRTLTAEVRISGHTGPYKTRGRALVGLGDPDALRLEGVAPFGQPAFILVASQGQGLLWLPRDNRVLRAPSPQAILEALTGIFLAPHELRDLLTGCHGPSLEPVGGEKIGDRWARLAFPNQGEAYLRRDGTEWRFVGASYPHVAFEYDDFAGNYPRRIWLRTLSTSPPAVDLRLVVAQLETNVTLAPETFTVKVPADATPLTLDELRAAGPLGAK